MCRKNNVFLIESMKDFVFNFNLISPKTSKKNIEKEFIENLIITFLFLFKRMEDE